jgi:hypothetical protein
LRAAWIRRKFSDLRRQICRGKEPWIKHLHASEPFAE